MVYLNVVEMIKELLETEEVYIFSTQEERLVQVYPHLVDPPSISRSRASRCLRDFLNFTPERISETPFAAIFHTDKNLQCIPFDESLLIALTDKPVSKALIGIIQEALMARVTQIQLRTKLKERDVREKTLFELHQQMMGGRAPEMLLEESLRFIKESLGYHNCAILLLNEEKTHLQIAAAINYPEETVKTIKIPVGQGVTGYCIEKDEIVIVNNVQKDEHYIPGVLDARSEMAVPLRVHGDAIGVLDVESERESFFDADDRLILEPIANFLAVSIENFRLYKGLEATNVELKETFIQTISALAEAIEVKDPYTRGHVSRSAHYGRVISGLLHLDETETDAVEHACILHDIGKIGIPERILLKQGPLTAEERSVIERHPLLSVQIIRNVESLRSVLPYIEHHHERWDGLGYPGRLKGEAIPLGARIVAIADAFDAMTTQRPYKEKRTFAGAIVELERERGKQFDPHLVDLFVEWLNQNPS